jgi:hypothetical protein
METDYSLVLANAAAFQLVQNGGVIFPMFSVVPRINKRDPRPMCHCPCRAPSRECRYGFVPWHGGYIDVAGPTRSQAHR